MALVRHYQDPSMEYYSDGYSISALYNVRGMDGAGVIFRAEVSMDMLTDEQMDELCVAMYRAAANMSFAVGMDVMVTQRGRRDYNIVEDDPQQPTP